MLRAADRFLFGLDYVFWSLGSSLRLNTNAYCELETIDGDFAFVANDGALVSLMQIDGMASMVGGKEFAPLMERLHQCLRSCLDSGQHTLQFTFLRDATPLTTRQLMEQAHADALATMQVLNLDLQDIWQAKIAMLSQHYCGKESLFLGLWTAPSGLPRQERRAMEKERRRRAAECPNGIHAMPLVGAARALRDMHRAACQTLLQDLQELGLTGCWLSVHDALRACRSTLSPELTSVEWLPRLPGDPLPSRMPGCDEAGDLSAVLWPTIASQLYPEGAELHGFGEVSLGDRCFATLSMQLGPRVVTTFNTFFRKLLNESVPWMLSIRMISDGYSRVAHKQLLSTLLSFLSGPRQVQRALSRVREAMEQGECFAGMQLQCSTWAASDARPLLRSRAARLLRAAQSWGGMELRHNDGNPLAALSATLPLLRHRSPSPISAVPVREVARLLPVTRPASPWTHGSMLLRTPDGKPFPYAFCSSRQKAWITLIFAPMGSGKSVLLSSLNMALVLAAGNRQLPRIAILDIGPSSSGLISLIREALPPQRREEVMYVRMRNTGRFMINPMDTLLGCRTPLASHKAFLSNFITLLATPVGEDKPYEAIPGMADMLLDLTYQAASDTGVAAKRYQPNIDAALDGQLRKHGFRADTHSTWWELVDYLFARQEYRAAARAQRHAVPTLSELVAHIHSDPVRDVYTGTVPDGNEDILHYCHRAITDALRRYPVLGGATCFDAEARILSLDLDEVAPRGGPDADRQTAIMYMLGRHAVCRDLYLRREQLDECPSPYRQWHEARLAADQGAIRRICFDEFHRTESVAAVRKQVLLDIREGRKWQVEVILASQQLRDFDSILIDLATTAFILGVGTHSLEETMRTFRLPDAAASALQELGSPGRDGASLLAWFNTVQGRFVHILCHTLTGEEIWAYSTTSEDMAVRHILYQRLGPVLARRVLACKYPGGSVKAECERRRALLSDGDMAKRNEGLIRSLALELVAWARDRMDSRQEKTVLSAALAIDTEGSIATPGSPV